MTKALQISTIGCVMLLLVLFAFGHPAAAQPPKKIGPAEKVANEWQLDGFQRAATTTGERIVTREYRSDKPLAELWHTYARKAGSKAKYQAGASGGESAMVGNSTIDFRFTSVMSDDEDKANYRVGVKSATLCFGTESGTVVIVLSRGKAESKTFVSMVVVAK